jgi:hypothetical protein
MRHVDRDAEFVLGTDRRSARDATPFDARETLRAAGLVGDVVVCTWINSVRKWRSPNATLACLSYAQRVPVRADQRWFCVDREREVDAHVAEGQVTVDQDADALLNHLEQLDIDQ